MISYPQDSNYDSSVGSKNGKGKSVKGAHARRERATPERSPSNASNTSYTNNMASLVVLETVEQSQELVSESRRRSKTIDNIVTEQLEDRICEVDTWRQKLSSLSRRLGEQAAVLARENQTLGVVVKRIEDELRDHVVMDLIQEMTSSEDVEVELDKEMKLLRSEHVKFIRRVREVERCLEEFRKIKVTIDRDVQMKSHSIRVDKAIAEDGLQSCLQASGQLTPRKKPPRSEESWLRHCQQLQRSGEAALRAAAELREDCRAMRAQLSCSAHAQAARVDCALRRRVHSNQNRIHDLRWQLEEIDRDTASLQSEQTETEKALYTCLSQQQRARTLRAVRASRAEREHCADEPEQRLSGELARLKHNAKELQENLEHLTLIHNTLDATRTDLTACLYDRASCLEVDLERARRRAAPAVERCEPLPASPRRDLAARSCQRNASLQIIHECDETEECESRILKA